MSSETFSSNHHFIRYHSSECRVKKNLEKIPLEYIQRGLIVVALACAVISLIPNLGWAGSLSLRSVACVAVGAQILTSMKGNENKGVILLQIIRLASVALGLAGVATHMNILVIASLMVDIGFQTLEGLRGLRQKDIYKSFCHSTFIVINSFVLIGLMTGAWPYLVTASTISAALMIAFAIKAGIKGGMKKDINAVFDVLSYSAFAIIGIAGAVRCAELKTSTPEKYHYSFHNKKDTTVTFYDRNGNIVAKAEPGETVHFVSDAKDTFSLTWDDYDGQLLADFGKQYGGFRYFYAESVDTTTTVIQNPMTAKEFPTLPVGGSSLASENPHLLEREIPDIDTDSLSAFLQPELEPYFPCFAYIVGGPTLKLIFGEKSFLFNRQELCANSTFISGILRMENIGENESHEIVFETESEKIFDSVIYYFSHGSLNRPYQIKEQELIELYRYAEYLGIDRLRTLCVQEIAARLKDLKWRNTSLLQEFKNGQEGGRLQELLNLFDFS